VVGRRDGVILEATFSDASLRDRALALADRANVPVLFVECRSSEREIERRLGERADHPDEVSDATLEVYRRERPRFAPLDELPESNRIVADTTPGWRMRSPPYTHALTSDSRSADPTLGLRANLAQFTLLVAVNGLVGAPLRRAWSS
jgi:hypothetical protein